MNTFSNFGTTIKETLSALKSQKPSEESNYKEIEDSRPHANDRFKAHYNKESSGTKGGKKNEPEDKFDIRSKAIMRIIVTLALLGISVFLLLDKSLDSKTLPCSIISAVTGYWLK